MSLGGLAIAIGLMVDGSVVVVENAFAPARRAPHGRKSRVRVILEAVLEVATPVIFGVGIIILVFLPLMTLQGMEGKMFAPLAYTIAIALVRSRSCSRSRCRRRLSSYLLKGGAEHDTLADPDDQERRTCGCSTGRSRTRRRRSSPRSPLLRRRRSRSFPFLGTAFIPEMKEGLDLAGDGPRAQHLARRVDRARDGGDAPRDGGAGRASRSCRGIGRGESPADPAGAERVRPDREPQAARRVARRAGRRTTSPRRSARS